MFPTHSLIRLLPFLFIFDLSAQSQHDPSSSEAAENKKINVRLIALGHRRTAKFARTRKAEVIKITTPDGEVIEEVIPAGTPSEIRGKEFEYLPSRIYIPNKDKSSSNPYLLRPLIQNACSPQLKITPRQSFDAYIRDRRGEKTQLKKYFSSPIAKEQTHMVTALVKRHTTLESWKEPFVKSFDTSYYALPPKSLLIFNGSPTNIEIQVPARNGEVEEIVIKPFASHQLRPGVNQRGETIVIAKMVYPNGKKRQFYYNSLKINDDGRAYLFTYCDPRKNASNPVGTVQFYDEIAPPPKKRN